MPQLAQRQPRTGPAPVVSLCNQLNAAIALAKDTRKEDDLVSSRLKQFAESLVGWNDVFPVRSQGILSSADIQVLVSHAWSQPCNSGALVQLLVVILQRLATAFGGASASSSARPRLSSRDAGYHRTCLMALANLMTCLSGFGACTPACWAQVASLLLRTHIPHALSRVLAALTAALDNDDQSSACCLLLHPLLTCAECFMGLGLRAVEDPLVLGSTPYADLLPSGSTHASDSTSTSRNTPTTYPTTAPSTATITPQFTKPPLVGPAMLWALADSQLAEHCCRAAMLGFEQGKSKDVLTSVSNFLTQLGSLACRLQLHAPQPVGGRASLIARDAVLSGPCLQYLLTADVLSQLHHVEGGGPLYGMPVQHLLPPKRLHSNIMDVLYTQTLVCTVVRGPMRTRAELRHSTLAAARACLRYLRFVVKWATQPGGMDEDPAAVLFLAVNVTREALVLMDEMDLGPADHTITPCQPVVRPRGTAAAAWASSSNRSSSSSSSSSDDGGGAAAGAGATGRGHAGEAERLPWAPGRRLGRRLLEEWWGSGLPLVHCVLNLGLVPSGGVEVYTALGEQGGMVALVARLAKTLTLKATALDEMPQGLPGGPCASPNVAAALSAGYLPCLERLMRVAQRQAGTGDRLLTQVLLLPLTRSSVLPQLLAYGDVRQAAALVLTVGKLLRRMGPSSIVAEMPLYMGGGGGGPSAARDTMTWLPGTLVTCLTHPDVALLWEEGQQEHGQQEEGQRDGGRCVQGPEDGEEGGGREGEQQAKQRELEQGPEGTAHSQPGASTSGGSSGGSGDGISVGSAMGGPAVDTQLLSVPQPLSAQPPHLPAPTRRALSLMSLALARWTAACLNGHSWEARPADVHTRARTASATAVAAIEAWDASTLSDVLGVLRPMRLMLCAALVAHARGDTRAVASWRQVLVRDMGLPGALAPVLEALAGVGKEEAAARGVDVVGEVDMSIRWLVTVPMDEMVADAAVPGAGGGPSRLQAAVRAVYGAHGGLRGGGVGKEGAGVGLGRAGQSEREVEGVSEQTVQWIREIADDALLGAAALLPPPCAAVEGMQLCGNPGCSNLGGDSEAGRPLQRCGGCRAVAYCCRECQTEHWKEGGHKEECKGKRA